MTRRLAPFVLLLGALYAAACGASFVGTATETTDPHNGWTDCRDGTWCPPEAPQCPFPGKGWKCGAPGTEAVGPGDTNAARRRDAGGDATVDAATQEWGPPGYGHPQ